MTNEIEKNQLDKTTSSLSNTSKDNQVCVLMVISMDKHNKKQTGANFNTFLSAFDKRYQLGEVHKLIIVVSGELHLNYIKLDKRLTEQEAVKLANEMDNDWINQNKHYLLNYQFDFQIITWKELIDENRELFNKFHSDLKNDYNNDNVFNKIVDDHSGGYHANRIYEEFKEIYPNLELTDCKKAAVAYGLEECAALILFNLKTNFFTYPGEMNPNFKYVYKKKAKANEIKIIYRPYTINLETLEVIVSFPITISKNTSKKAIKDLLEKEITKTLKNTSEENKKLLIKKIYFILNNNNNKDLETCSTNVNLEDLNGISTTNSTSRKESKFLVKNFLNQFFKGIPPENAETYGKKILNIVKKNN